MLESNERDLERFVAEKRRNDTSEYTIETYVRFMTELDEQINKPFRDATEEDINRFVDMKARYCSKKSMVLCKTITKTFYKWLFGLKDTYPPAVAKLETSTRRHSNGGGNAEDLDIKDVLTKDDIALLIKNCLDDREEAMIAVLYESGARIGEFIGMKVGDLAEAKHGKKVTIHGKTGSRTILLVESVPYVNKWLSHYPTNVSPNAPLWCRYKYPYEVMEIGGVEFLLRELKRRSVIQKKLNPHNFRHSRATYLARFMSDAQMKIYFGWSKASSMQAIYVHLAGKDNDGAILRSAGIEETEDVVEKSPLQEKECPRCHSMNAGTNEYCGLCGLPFDQRRIIEQTLDEQKLKDEVRVLREEIMKTEGVGEYLDHLQTEIERLHKQLAMLNNGGKER